MDDSIAALFWFIFLCCLPVIAVGGPVGWVTYRNRQRQEGSKAIGEALGLAPTVKAKQMQWYEGRLANGRLAAYLPITFPRHTYLEGRRRTVRDSAARVVVEVNRERPLDVDAFRHQSWTKSNRPFDSFDNAFNLKNGSKLTGAQQQALIDFARSNDGTVWLGDRAGASPDVFNAPEVMAEATSFILYEFQAKNPTPTEIDEKTAELSRLAQLFDER